MGAGLLRPGGELWRALSGPERADLGLAEAWVARLRGLAEAATGGGPQSSSMVAEGYTFYSSS